MNKILTYDYKKTIRACYAEETDNAKKETYIQEAVVLMQGEGMKFYKYEDTTTGKLIGYGIFDSNANSLKRFNRP